MATIEDDIISRFSFHPQPTSNQKKQARRLLP